MSAIPIRFEIGSPREGWCQISMTSGDFKFGFLASHAPWDSIADLAQRAEDLLTGQQFGEVRWHLEPGAFQFRLLFGGERSAFELHEFADSRLRQPMNPGPIFGLELGTRALTSAVWRALRRLQGSITEESYQKEWRHPFPTEAVKRLGEALKRTK